MADLTHTSNEHHDLCSSIIALSSASYQTRKQGLEMLNLLLTQVSSKKRLYNSVKACPLTIATIQDILRDSPGEDGNTLLKIATLNHNGYVREYALNALRERKAREIFPFLLFRAADWVKEVRTLAVAMIEEYLQQEHLLEILENFYLLSWLEKVQRVNLRDVLEKIVNFAIVLHFDRSAALFTSVDEKNRRVFVQEVIRVAPQKILKLPVISDKSMLVRMQLLKVFNILSREDQEMLLRDRSSRIRREALEQFVDLYGTGKYLYPYLFDTSSNIRYAARYYLRDQQNDFVRIYKESLAADRHVCGSMLGLSDLNITDAKTIIESYLQSNNAAEVKTALFVLAKFGSSVADDFIAINLLREDFKFRTSAFKYLTQRYVKEAVEELEINFSHLSEALKVATIRFCSHLGGYDRLIYFLRGLADGSAQVRKVSAQALNSWVSQAYKNYMSISDEEKTEVLAHIHHLQEKGELHDELDADVLNVLESFLG